MRFILKTLQTEDPDPAHSEQVTAFAVALFDGLQAVHRLGPGERRLLEIAGRLHDIGWSRAFSGEHHKLSRDMILDSEIPGLGELDRLVCALIAHYHAKGPPDPSRHRRFASLDPGRREIVEWLAGMLRVADGLDCNHAGAFRRLSCRVGRRRLLIRIEAPRGCQTGFETARQKQGLLEQKVGRRIEYRRSKIKNVGLRPADISRC
jgi:exopolyphosphatase / guanosine-5'-triphosphate,3'-diphosphate pyrophosphatase